MPPRVEAIGSPARALTEFLRLLFKVRWPSMGGTMTGRRIASFFAGLLTLFVAACATSERIDPKDPSLSLVYGYIDMKDAPSSLGWVHIALYDGKNTGYFTAVRDGLFLHIGVKPGPYQVDRFGRHTTFWSNTEYSYDFGTRGRNETAIRIDKPGIYFMGAYKYAVVHTGFFEQSKFRMEQTAAPSERELLTRVLAFLQDDPARYARQIDMVKQRLAQLR
jgi:hypothetical protein